MVASVALANAWDVPAGWTLADTQQRVVSTSNTAVFYKFANYGSAGSLMTLTNPGTAAKCSIVLSAFSGVDTTNPIHKINFKSVTTSSTSVTTPTVTTTAANCMLVESLSEKDSVNIANVTPGSPLVRRAYAHGSSGGNSGSAIADRLVTTAGTYGGETWTTDVATTVFALYTLALTPATGLPPKGAWTRDPSGNLTLVTPRVLRNSTL
jgi:hypothetical protein